MINAVLVWYHKTYINMRLVFMLLAFCFVFQSNAADTTNTQQKQQKLFIRLYNNTGKKIAKGYLLEGEDSAIEIKHQHKITSYAVKDIHSLKTRRSAGHSVLLGAAIGTAAGIILITAGAATDNPDPFITNSTSFSLALAGTAAPFIGVITGGVAAALRKRETIEINGDVEKWKTAREKLFFKHG